MNFSLTKLLTYLFFDDILKVIKYILGAFMKKVLISAFLPFNRKGNNYSAEVLKYVSSDSVEIDKVIVDVIYDKCFDELSTYGLDNYDYIIAMGEARMRDVLTVEKRAKNISSCSLPDNSGEIKQNEVIDPSFGEYIENEMDLSLFCEFAEISCDAGKFVCNNMYFHLLSYDAKRTLFIHIPECNNDIEAYISIADKVKGIIESL